MQVNPFRALLPTLEKIGATDSFFAAVKEDFPQFMQQGFFESRPHAALYICAIQTPVHNALGIIASAHVQDYLEGAIKRHESTIPAKEAVQIQLWKEQQAMIKPVLLAYPSVTAIEVWMQKMVTQKQAMLTIPFPAEGQTYQVWEIGDPTELQYIQELFAAFVPRAYIADGHHRCSSSALLYEQTLLRGNADPYFLAAFFPSTQLYIQSYHRLLDEVDLPAEDLLQHLEAFFLMEALEQPEVPRHKFELCFLVENKAFRLNWRPELLERYRWEKAILDTQLFNEVILPNVFGIVDVRQSTRLIYLEGGKGIERLYSEQQMKAQRVAFALYPVDLQEMMILADHNQSLPPKSTWFEPRMKNGVVVKAFNIFSI